MWGWRDIVRKVDRRGMPGRWVRTPPWPLTRNAPAGRLPGRGVGWGAWPPVRRRLAPRSAQPIEAAQERSAALTLVRHSVALALADAKLADRFTAQVVETGLLGTDIGMEKHGGPPNGQCGRARRCQCPTYGYRIRAASLDCIGRKVDLCRFGEHLVPRHWTCLGCLAEYEGQRFCSGGVLAALRRPRNRTGRAWGSTGANARHSSPSSRATATAWVRLRAPSLP